MKINVRLVTLLAAALISSGTGLFSPAEASGPLHVLYDGRSTSDNNTAFLDSQTYNDQDVATIPTLAQLNWTPTRLGYSFVAWCSAPVSPGSDCSSAGGTVYNAGDTFTISATDPRLTIFSNLGNVLPFYPIFRMNSCNQSSISTDPNDSSVYMATFVGTPSGGCTWNLPAGVNHADVLFVAPGTVGGSDSTYTYAGAGGQVKIIPWITTIADYSSTHQIYLQVGEVGQSNTVTEFYDSHATQQYWTAYQAANPDYASPSDFVQSNYIGYKVYSTANQAGNEISGGGQINGGTYPDGGLGFSSTNFAQAAVQSGYRGLFADDATCYGGGGAISEYSSGQSTALGSDGCGNGPATLVNQAIHFDTPTANTGVGGSTIIVDGVPTYGPTSAGVVKVRFTYAPHQVITYDGNNATTGSVPQQQFVFPSTGIQIASGNGLTRSGYVFSSWCTVQTLPDQSCTSQGGITYHAGDMPTISTDMTLYAQWVTQYSITYYGNQNTSGSVPSPTEYVNGSGDSIQTNINNLARSGAAFAGWCSVPTQLNESCAAENGTVYGAPSQPTLTHDLSLYAMWGTAYSVTYLANGGTGSAPVDNSSPYPDGATVAVTGNVQLSNGSYSFAGWCTAPALPDQACSDAGGQRYVPDFFDGSFTIHSNVNLYALWSTLSSNDNFQSLTFQNGTLSPALDNNVETYTVTIATGVTSVYFTANSVDHRSILLYSTNNNPTEIQPSTLAGPIQIGSTDTTTALIGIFAEQGFGLQDPTPYLKILSVTFVHRTPVTTTTPPPAINLQNLAPAPAPMTTPVQTAAPAATTPAAPMPTVPANLVITPGVTTTQQLPTATGTSWSLATNNSTPSGITVTPTGALTVAPDQAPGKYLVNLVSTDSTGTQTTQAVTVVVPGTPKVVITTSPTGIPVVAVTDPVDDAPKLAVVSTDKGVGAMISSTGAVLVTDPTFSGNLNVQLKASNQYGLSATAVVKVTVNPTDVTDVAANVSTNSVQTKENALAKTETVVTWQPAQNATSYQVKVDGKVVGETTGSTLSVANVYGPSHQVEVVPLGNDGTVGNPIATHIPVKSVAVGSLTFAGTTVTLTKRQKKVLATLAKQVEANGITTITLKGIINSVGLGTSNKALATQRATAIKTFLQSKVSGTGIKFVVTATKKATTTVKSKLINRVDVVVR